MLLVGAFGASLVGIALLERAGVKINEGSLQFVLEMLKFGAIVYFLKMAASLLL